MLVKNVGYSDSEREARHKENNERRLLTDESRIMATCDGGEKRARKSKGAFVISYGSFFGKVVSIDLGLWRSFSP